ncbi:MAG: rod shape-determining protein RodA [Pseudomonadota bacterium]
MTGGTAWRQVRRRLDWTLLLVTLTIVGLGLVNLYSATSHAPKRGLLSQQVLWLIVSGVACCVLAVLDYRLWLRVAWVLLVVGMLAVIAVHFFGIAVKGSRRWLGFGSMRGQPSEFIKLAVIIALARFVHDRGASANWWMGVAAPIAAFISTIVLIAWQPDLGTATLVALVCLSVAALSANRLWPIAATVGAVALAAPPIWAYVLRDYQKRRILTFVDPSADPSGAGWQSRQSILAVGSGRWAGKGFLHGTQNQLNFLPEQWTDFPFSVWAEEWGFLGSVVMLALYFVLVLWIINIASQARDRFGAALCLGVGAMLFWQVVVNIGMVIGLAPVVGVTLPLASYGGSSVLTVFMGIGLVGSVSLRRYAR